MCGSAAAYGGHGGGGHGGGLAAMAPMVAAASVATGTLVDTVAMVAMAAMAAMAAAGLAGDPTAGITAVITVAVAGARVFIIPTGILISGVTPGAPFLFRTRILRRQLPRTRHHPSVTHRPSDDARRGRTTNNAVSSLTCTFSGVAKMTRSDDNVLCMWWAFAFGMLSKYAVMPVAVLLLIGCATAPSQDSGWRACWVGTWIACK